MNKSKYELPDYFGLYNSALSAYAKAVLGANALMLEYGAAATRTMLRATALAAPVAPAPVVPASAPGRRDSGATAPPTDSIDNELARIEASLYSGDAQPHSLAASAIEPVAAQPAGAQPAVPEPAPSDSAAEPAGDVLGTTLSPRLDGSKKDAVRRRRGKK